MAGADATEHVWLGVGQKSVYKWQTHTSINTFAPADTGSFFYAEI